MIDDLVSFVEEDVLSLIGLVHGDTFNWKRICLCEDYFDIVSYFGVITGVNRLVGLVLVLDANFGVFAVFHEVGFSLVEMGVNDEGVACQVMNRIRSSNINYILFMLHKFLITIPQQNRLFLERLRSPQR